MESRLQGANAGEVRCRMDKLDMGIDMLRERVACCSYKRHGAVAAGVFPDVKLLFTPVSVSVI